MRWYFFVLATCMAISGQASAATPAEACTLDLQAIAAYLLENDAGAQQHLAQKGQLYFDLALANATTAATRVSNDNDCVMVLSKYVHMWRKGHLDVLAGKAQKVTQPAAVPTTAEAQVTQSNTLSRAPSISILSDTTVLLHFPSFYPDYQAAIASL